MAQPVTTESAAARTLNLPEILRLILDQLYNHHRGEDKGSRVMVRYLTVTGAFAAVGYEVMWSEPDADTLYQFRWSEPGASRPSKFLWSDLPAYSQYIVHSAIDVRLTSFASAFAQIVASGDPFANRVPQWPRLRTLRISDKNSSLKNFITLVDRSPFSNAITNWIINDCPNLRELIIEAAPITSSFAAMFKYLPRLRKITLAVVPKAQPKAEVLKCISTLKNLRELGFRTPARDQNSEDPLRVVHMIPDMLLPVMKTDAVLFHFITKLSVAMHTDSALAVLPRFTSITQLDLVLMDDVRDILGMLSGLRALVRLDVKVVHVRNQGKRMLKFSTDSFSALGSLRKLRHLSLRSPYHSTDIFADYIGDEHVAAIARCMPDLQHLYLRLPSCCTRRLLHSLAITNPKLVTLRLAGWWNLDLPPNAVQPILFPQLQYLELELGLLYGPLALPGHDIVDVFVRQDAASSDNLQERSLQELASDSIDGIQAFAPKLLALDLSQVIHRRPDSFPWDSKPMVTTRVWWQEHCAKRLATERKLRKRRRALRELRKHTYFSELA